MMLTHFQDILLLCGGTFFLSEGMDLYVHPRRLGRSWKRLPLRFLPVLAVGSFFIVLSGSSLVALLAAGIILFVLAVGSNLKLRLLNEPLVFTDLTLIVAFFRHPKFYLQAISLPARIGVALGGIALSWLLVCVSSADIVLRLYAFGIGLGAIGCLWGILWWDVGQQQMPEPCLWEDTQKHGLLPTLLLYAFRWTRLRPLPVRPRLSPCETAPDAVIVVQCESFADPAALKRQWSSLPELKRCQTEAVQWGNLLPSGLGAYTMRSEYGLLCGDDDASLSYRQFDPFLTAQHMASHSLAYRVSALYQNMFFVHPYDMRFYGRDKIMPSLGFGTLIGREAFHNNMKVGPYIGDKSLTEYLSKQIREQDDFFTYCVTIENHGPWKAGRLNKDNGEDAWHEHARHGDEMLGKLYQAIKASGKDIMLVFFGDHRPALGPVPPVEGLERSTPYVILRPGSKVKGELQTVSKAPVPLTPAALHHTILGMISS